MLLTRKCCDPGDGCAGECADERGGSAQSADREQAGAGAPGNGPAPAAGPANQVHACLSFLCVCGCTHTLYTYCTLTVYSFLHLGVE